MNIDNELRGVLVMHSLPGGHSWARRGSRQPRAVRHAPALHRARLQGGTHRGSCLVILSNLWGESRRGQVRIARKVRCYCRVLVLPAPLLEAPQPGLGSTPDARSLPLL